MLKKIFLAIFTLMFFQCDSVKDSDEEEQKPLDQKGVAKARNKKEHSMLNASHNIFDKDLIALEDALAEVDESLDLHEIENDYIVEVLKKKIEKTLMGIIVANAANRHVAQNLLLLDSQRNDRRRRSTSHESNPRAQLWKIFFDTNKVENLEAIVEKLAKQYLVFIMPEKISQYKQSCLKLGIQAREFWGLAKHKCNERSNCF